MSSWIRTGATTLALFAMALSVLVGGAPAGPRLHTVLCGMDVGVWLDLATGKPVAPEPDHCEHCGANAQIAPPPPGPVNWVPVQTQITYARWDAAPAPTENAIAPTARAPPAPVSLST